MSKVFIMCGKLCSGKSTYAKRIRKAQKIQLLLARDVHAPAPIRANIPPRNFSEWYEAFGVTDKDQMYIAPNKRISIW